MTLLPVAYPLARIMQERHEIDAAIGRVIDSGRFVLGEEVQRFESEFAAYIGASHGVGVASGTDAVELALRACGIGRGDLVFTVANTAVGTLVGIERTGALPVLCDIDASYTLAPGSLEKAIASASASRLRELGAPKAVLAVHLYGMPSNLEEIGAIADRHGLQLIEDCAQAHGAAIGARRVGSFGRASAFSFYPTKNLGCIGDGGMVVTADAAVAQRARELREYGWTERYVSDVPGTNSRLDELQAAILRVLLPSLDASNDHRRLLAGCYETGLAADPAIALPTIGPPDSYHVYHQYVVRSPSRDALRQRLITSGVGTAILYPVPLHRQHAYAGRLPLGDSLHETERACREILSLPIGAHVSSEDVSRVVSSIRNFHHD